MSVLSDTITNKKTVTTLTDKELVMQYKESSDGSVFGEIYNRYHKRVYLICLDLLKNGDTAFDMVQDIMFKVKERLAQIENEFLLNLWINRIAENHCTDYLKQLNQPLVSDLEETL